MIPGHHSGPPFRVTDPSHHSESPFRVTIPGHHSESPFRVTIPSHHSESPFRVTIPSHHSESPIRVTVPSCVALAECSPADSGPEVTRTARATPETDWHLKARRAGSSPAQRPLPPSLPPSIPSPPHPKRGRQSINNPARAAARGPTRIREPGGAGGRAGGRALFPALAGAGQRVSRSCGMGERGGRLVGVAMEKENKMGGRGESGSRAGPG
jgi:hypothetical protein